MNIEDHPRYAELSKGQQTLASKIINAGLANSDEVVTAFADRHNLKIGRWKQSLERDGLAPDKTAGIAVDPQRSSAGRAGVANSPWNYGHPLGDDPGLVR